MHILYMLTFPNGKIYIGQTVRAMHTRLAQHRQSSRNGSNLPVHCAWRMHGEPDVTVLAELESQEALHAAEIATIKALGTICPNGYNLGHGGETAPSKNHDVAKKISLAASGRKYADTTQWSVASTEHWKDEAYRNKVSEGLKKAWTDEMREAASKRSLTRWEKRKAEGWKMPESQKKKLSERVVTPETRAKMSESAKGKKKPARSDAHREKLSEATKDAWANRDNTKRIASIKAAWDEEARSDMSEKAKNTWKDPEVRQKRIAAIKAAKLKKR